MSSACHSRAAFGTAAPQGKQRGTPSSAFIPNRYQAAFEAGVFFVLCEGLLRRLLPGAGAYILSFKFAYFPLVYCYLIAVLPRARQTPWLVPGAGVFLAWGTLITVAHLWWYSVVGLAGLLVNTAFVPVACFAALLYRDEDELRGVFLRLTSFAGLVGTMAIYQATLPADHWLNMSVDMAASGIRDGLGVRVPGTFQFCNVFGQYASGGLIACCGTIYAARNKLESAWGIGCGALLYFGVMESGSRMGALGSLAVVGACLAGSARLWTRVADAALLGVIAMGLVFLCSPSLLWRADSAYAARAAGRSFYVDDALDRIGGMYFFGMMDDSITMSSGIGLGWGPCTMGVPQYARRLFAIEVPQQPGDFHIEGGYSYLLTQVGIVGAALFFYVHAMLVRLALRSHSELGWLGLAVAAWSIVGNLPLGLQEVSVLAILWWFLTGIAVSHLAQ
jgi:hypothetical protein